MLNLQTERIQDRHSSAEQLATSPDLLFFFFFYQFIPERLPSSRRPSEWPSQVKLALAMVCSRPVGHLRVLSKSASSFFFFLFYFFLPPFKVLFSRLKLTYPASTSADLPQMNPSAIFFRQNISRKEENVPFFPPPRNSREREPLVIQSAASSDWLLSMISSSSRWRMGGLEGGSRWPRFMEPQLTSAARHVSPVFGHHTLRWGVWGMGGREKQHHEY